MNQPAQSGRDAPRGAAVGTIMTEVETAALLAVLARHQRDEERRRADMTHPRPARSVPIEQPSPIERPNRWRQAIRSVGSRVGGKSAAPRVVVYTAVLDHGSRPAPNESGPGVDHVCFSSDAALVPPGWTHLPMPYRGMNAAQTLLYVATHPTALLGDYDVTAWVSPTLLGGRSSTPIVDALNGWAGGLPDWSCLPSAPDHVESELTRVRQAGVSGSAAFHERLDAVLHGELPDPGHSSAIVVRSNRSSRAATLDRAWWSASLATGASADACLHLAIAATGISVEPLGDDVQQAHRSLLGQPPVALGRARRAAFDPQIERARIRSAIDHHAATLQQTRSDHPSCAVVVPVHDAPDFTKQCLESVIATVPAHVEVVVVDDGSAAETAALCRRFASDHGVTVIRNETASGFGAAANHGLATARGHEHVVVLNSDTIVPAGWIERLQAHLMSAPTVGAIGPLSNDARHQSVPHASDSNADWAHHERNEPPGHLDVDAVNCFLAVSRSEAAMIRVPVLNGFCMMFSRTALDLVGGFDVELFARGYGEEADWCFRAVDAGLELAVALDTYVYHAKSRSYTGDAIPDLKAAAATNLSSRWGDTRPQRALRSLERSEVLRSVRADTEVLFVLASDPISVPDARR